MMPPAPLTSGSQLGRHRLGNGFFDGLEMVPPGLVQLHRWRPDPGADVSYEIPAYSGIGRKP